MPWSSEPVSESDEEDYEQQAKRTRIAREVEANGTGKEELYPNSPVLCSTPAGNEQVRPISFAYEMRPDGAAFKATAAVPLPPVDISLS
jgi:hypothetical protein